MICAVPTYATGSSVLVTQNVQKNIIILSFVVRTIGLVSPSSTQLGEIGFVYPGWHRWALSPISVISDIGLSLISELRYRTERAESDIMSDIGIKFYLISDLQHPHLNRKALWLSVIVLLSHFKARNR